MALGPRWFRKCCAPGLQPDQLQNRVSLPAAYHRVSITTTLAPLDLQGTACPPGLEADPGEGSLHSCLPPSFPLLCPQGPECPLASLPRSGVAS